MMDKQMEKFSAKSKVEGGKMLKNWLISHGMTLIAFFNKEKTLVSKSYKIEELLPVIISILFVCFKTLKALISAK